MKATTKIWSSEILRPVRGFASHLQHGKTSRLECGCEILRLQREVDGIFRPSMGHGEVQDVRSSQTGANAAERNPRLRVSTEVVAVVGEYRLIAHGRSCNVRR